MASNSKIPSVVDYGIDDSEAFQAHSSDARPALGPRPGLVEQFAATIRTTPCASNVNADYTDARYFLDRSVVGAAGSAPLAVRVDSFPGLQQCLTATNLAELAAGSHSLTAGTVVQVFALYTRAGEKTFVFNHPPTQAAVVQISGASEGGGKYSGSVLAGSSTAAEAGDLAMPEGMGGAGGEALILNAEEDGLTGHRLALSSYAVGCLVGMSAGKTLVVVRGALGSRSSSTSMGDGMGGSTDPDSTAWSKDSDATPLSVWVQTRTVWDSDSGTLYGYLRQFSFDARGVLYAVSGENQITVDVATECE